MPQEITPGAAGDTPKVVEDKTRMLPDNQPLNNHAMWEKVDTEIVAARRAGKLRNTEAYKPEDKHGAS